MGFVGGIILPVIVLLVGLVYYYMCIRDSSYTTADGQRHDMPATDQVINVTGTSQYAMVP